MPRARTWLWGALGGVSLFSTSCALGPAGSAHDASHGAEFASLHADTFARARAEHRNVLVDGSAPWCHWCREMDATSYSDPEVQRLIKDKYVTVKIDVDDEPAFERRYRDWGWPATVIMSADAEEIAKYRGFLPAQRLAEVLRDNSGS